MSNNNLQKYLIEVQSKVHSKAYNAPTQRKLFKQGYSFSEQSASEQLIIWDYIWNHSHDFWTAVQAYLFLESQIKNMQFLLNSWNIIKHWQKAVFNWGMCDGLSKIYTKILEIIPNEVLEQLRPWNKSENPWDKRQSVVSLLYFSRTKKTADGEFKDHRFSGIPFLGKYREKPAEYYAAPDRHP